MSKYVGLYHPEEKWFDRNGIRYYLDKGEHDPDKDPRSHPFAIDVDVLINLFEFKEDKIDPHTAYNRLMDAIVAYK